MYEHNAFYRLSLPRRLTRVRSRRARCPVTALIYILKNDNLHAGYLYRFCTLGLILINSLVGSFRQDWLTRMVGTLRNNVVCSTTVI